MSSHSTRKLGLALELSLSLSLSRSDDVIYYDSDPRNLSTGTTWRPHERGDMGH